MTDSHEIRRSPEASGEVEASGARAELVGSACIVVVNGPSAGRVFQLHDSEILVGRDALAQVRFEDKSISTRHAKLRVGGDHDSVMDLGSMNGTFLNGHRLPANEPTPLSPSDSIQFADTIVAYLPQGARPAQEQTQYLAHIAPRFPGSSAQNLPEAQLIAQLLRAEPAQATEPPRVSLEERVAQLMRILQAVRRNWVPLFAATTLLALVGILTVLLNPPLSEATCRLRVTPPSDERNGNHDHTTFYATSEQDFSSAPLLESTLKSLGRDRSRDDISAQTELLKLESVAHMTYAASYRARDPKTAVAFLRKHVENYIAWEVHKTLQVVQAEVDFLSARVKEREDELRKTEEELKSFKQEHLQNLPEFTQGAVTSREGLYARRAELSAQLSKTNLELELARRRLKEQTPLLRKKLESAAPYEQALVEVKRKLGEARAKGLGESHPDVLVLKNQETEYQRLVSEARAQEANDLERSANPGLIDLKNRADDLAVASRGAGAELGAISAQLERLDSMVSSMPEVEARYAQLTRSYAVSKQMHAQLFERLRTSEIQLELEQTSAKARYQVLSPPESLGVPIRKILLLRAAMFGALGLVLGAVLAAILELRRYLNERRVKGTAVVPAFSQSSSPSRYSGA